MSYSSGEAAEQVVRMTLNGVEVAAKISGKAAERLAVLLYAVLQDQKKTRGKTRLTSMLKSGKEIKVFSIGDKDIEKFCREAKKYGVLYCVLKDKTAADGHTDVFVRAEDASKINRIFERFGIATADIGSARAEIVKEQEKIRRNYAKLGKVYYKDYVTDEEPDDAEYKPICEEISVSFRRINELREEIAAAKAEYNGDRASEDENDDVDVAV